MAYEIKVGQGSSGKDGMRLASKLEAQSYVVSWALITVLEAVEKPLIKNMKVHLSGGCRF